MSTKAKLRVLTGAGVDGIFWTPGSEERIYKLEHAFEYTTEYGRHLDWTVYSVHDAAHVMVQYFQQLPEPVIPLNHYTRFTMPLRKFERYTHMDPPHEFDQKEAIEAIRVYRGLIAELPLHNRVLFLYILNFLNVFATNKERNKTDSLTLAARFQPGLLTRYRAGFQEALFNQDVLVFLFEHEDNFFMDIPKKAPNDKPIGSAQRTDIVELGKPAQRRILPRSASVNTLPPLSASVTANTSSKEGSLKTSKSMVPSEDRTELRKEDSEVDSGKQHNGRILEATAATGNTTLRTVSSWRQNKLATHDQRRVDDSKVRAEFESANADTHPLSLSSGVQEMKKMSSPKELDFGRNKKGAIENLVQKRANSSNPAGSYVIPKQDDAFNPLLDDSKDQNVMRSGKQSSTTSTSDPERNLTKRLGHYFLEGNEPRVEFSESEINDISKLLLRLNPSWSRIPRVYIVLRIIGCLHAMSIFIDAGFSDYNFPVTARSLPHNLSPKARSDFVKNQTVVMTKSLNLEKIEGGQHCFFRKNEYIPLRVEGLLGVGGFGQVDKVLSLISFKSYARKRVSRASDRNAAAQKAFIREIGILKRLKHDHIVEFVGSYTDHKYIAVLTEPIANMDFAKYLERADTTKHLELRTFFGCLSRALEFLHEQNIRHKDIKPQNILYEKDRRILLTDFGLSLDFTDDSRSTTMSMVNGMTPMYCAPEVAAEEPRGTSSDIYSLGIVFLEMIVVLKGHSVKYLQAYFETHGSKNRLIRENDEALNEFLAELGNTPVVSDNKVLMWVEKMLQNNPKIRPTAASLSTWCTLPDDNGKRQFSGICCLSLEESYSEVSDDHEGNGLDSLRGTHFSVTQSMNLESLKS
jgi:serine/threonine protein kinase